MKIICLATILFLCGGLPSRPAQSQEPPPSLMPKLEGAEVRIPYTELKQLWDAAAATSTKAPSTPLPAGALLAVAYQADLSVGQVALEAEFRVESFTGQFEQIRLTGADWAVASVEPADARITVAGDDLVLLAKDPGQQVVKVRFANQPLPSTADQPLLRLHTVPSAVTALTLKGVPEGRILKSGAYLVTPANGSAYLPLSAKGGEVTLTLGMPARPPNRSLPLSPANGRCKTKCSSMRMKALSAMRCIHWPQLRTDRLWRSPFSFRQTPARLRSKAMVSLRPRQAARWMAAPR